MRPVRLVIPFAFLILVTLAGCKSNRGPTGPTPTDDIHYGAIGASDGIGFGGTIACTPLDHSCQGTGYVHLLRRRMQTDGRTVTLLNLSLPGGVLSPAIQTLARQIGREVLTNFMEQQAPFITPAQTHITIFAGGNDANTIAQAVRAGQGGQNVRGFIDQHVRQWGTDYEEMIRRIRTRTPNARIVALNLPNLGAAPYVAGLTVAERSILQYIAVSLADRVNALTGMNVLVVDLLCDRRVYEPANFSSDGFHPNDRGYAVMADAAFPALSNGTATAPSSSCPQRTLLPAF